MNFAQKRIFVVEDDPDILDAITLILEDQGLDVDQDTTGEKILNVEVPRTNLFIIDGQLPKCKGIDLCHKIKNNLSTMDIPIIFMSASREAVYRAVKEGFSDVLHKPFNLNHFKRMVKSKLE